MQHQILKTNRQIIVFIEGTRVTFQMLVLKG